MTFQYSSYLGLRKCQEDLALFLLKMAPGVWELTHKSLCWRGEGLGPNAGPWEGLGAVLDSAAGMRPCFPLLTSLLQKGCKE